MFGQPDLRFLRAGFLKNCFFQNMSEVVVLYLVASTVLVITAIVTFANAKKKRAQGSQVTQVLTSIGAQVIRTVYIPL